MIDLQTAVALSLVPGRARFEVVRRLGPVPDPAPLEVLIAALGGDAQPAARAPELAREAAQHLGRARSGGIAAVPWFDPRYPVRLLGIADAPAVLWCRGDVAAALDAIAVAVVGTRAPTPHGRTMARSIAAGLAAAGCAVVSGLARGIDAAAHRGALEQRALGATVAVLGSGVDVVYPAEHAGLADDIAARGAIVSELPPGTSPQKHHFPLRNRIISGLAAAVVVVEAAERSGSLITARWALEQGRDVMAVPGGVASGRNRGAHALIRDGARLVESADDVLAELGLSGRDARCARPESGSPPDPVVAAMEVGEPMDLDQLVSRTGWPVSRLLERLLEAELAGGVRRIDGGRFVRSGR